MFVCSIVLQPLPPISDGVDGGYCNTREDCINQDTVCELASSTCVFCNGTFHAFDGYCVEGSNPNYSSSFVQSLIFMIDCWLQLVWFQWYFARCFWYIQHNHRLIITLRRKHTLANELINCFKMVYWRTLF